jgi:hypothetical protein
MIRGRGEGQNLVRVALGFQCPLQVPLSFVRSLEQGPSATMDTACSSSLVAADTAAATLRRRHRVLPQHALGFLIYGGHARGQGSRGVVDENVFKSDRPASPR